MISRFHRIALTAAVLPLVLLVGLRSAWAAYACQMDRVVRTECCCPAKPKRDRAPIDDTTRMQAPACCNLVLGEASAAPDAREAERLRSEHAPFVAACAPSAHAPATRSTISPTRASHARPPPPLLPVYLANRSILR